MFKDMSHYFILQMLNKNSKKITAEIYEKLSESGKANLKVGDVPVAYFIKNAECIKMKMTSLLNAVDEIATLKLVEFNSDVPVFEV